MVRNCSLQKRKWIVKGPDPSRTRQVSTFDNAGERARSQSFARAERQTSRHRYRDVTPSARSCAVSLLVNEEGKVTYFSFGMGKSQRPAFLGGDGSYDNLEIKHFSSIERASRRRQVLTLDKPDYPPARKGSNFALCTSEPHEPTKASRMPRASREEKRVEQLLGYEPSLSGSNLAYL